MTFKKYQKEIDDALSIYDPPYWSPLSQLARLIEEVGEVARIMNHSYGDKPKKPDEEHSTLEDELGDVLFDMMCMANSLNLDLEAGLQRAITKLQTRDKDRFKKKQA